MPTLMTGAFVLLALGATLMGQRTGGPAQEATQPVAGGRAPRNVAELDELFRQVSNWGRWGKDDQLGAANLVTDAKRKQAAALVKNGISVSLAHNPMTEKAVDNNSPFEHTMIPGFFMDTYKVSYHGYAHSHIDALCHILYKDQTYNGYPRSEVEFMVTIAPVPVTGGTGFPVNTIATF
jgi:hypothetical protein